MGQSLSLINLLPKIAKKIATKHTDAQGVDEKSPIQGDFFSKILAKIENNLKITTTNKNPVIENILSVAKGDSHPKVTIGELKNIIANAKIESKKIIFEEKQHKVINNQSWREDKRESRAEKKTLKDILNISKDLDLNLKKIKADGDIPKNSVEIDIEPKRVELDVNIPTKEHPKIKKDIESHAISLLKDDEIPQHKTIQPEKEIKPSNKKEKIETQYIEPKIESKIESKPTEKEIKKIDIKIVEQKEQPITPKKEIPIKATKIESPKIVLKEEVTIATKEHSKTDIQEMQTQLQPLKKVANIEKLEEHPIKQTLTTLLSEKKPKELKKDNNEDNKKVDTKERHIQKIESSSAINEIKSEEKLEIKKEEGTNLVNRDENLQRIILKNSVKEILSEQTKIENQYDKKEITKDTTQIIENKTSAQNISLQHITKNDAINIPKDVPLTQTFGKFAQDLSDEIKEYKSPFKKISMELNPKNLGSLEVTIRSFGSNLQISITSSLPTMQLFMQNTNDVRVALQNVGFQDVEMNFSSFSGNGGGNQGDRREDRYRNANSLYQEEENMFGEMGSLELILPRYI